MTWPAGSDPFTRAGGDHVAPPSREAEITTSLWPSLRNRVSCHTTYMASSVGSTVAAGSPPVRRPGSPAPRNSAMLTGGPKVRPPSVEVWATSKSWAPTVWSYTMVRSPFDWTTGSSPSTSSGRLVTSIRSLHVCPSSSEYRRTPTPEVGVNSVHTR